LTMIRSVKPASAAIAATGAHIKSPITILLVRRVIKLPERLIAGRSDRSQVRVENADKECPARFCALQKCILHCSLFGAGGHGGRDAQPTSAESARDRE
jgi:hypothetical protein